MATIYGTKLTANDDEVVIYLNKLWKSYRLPVYKRSVSPNKRLIDNDNNNNPNKRIKFDNQVNDNKVNDNQVNDNQVNDNKVKPIIKNLDINTLKSSLYELRKIGFWVYNDQRFESELNLKPKKVTTRDIKNVVAFNFSDQLTKEQLLKNISRCTIIPKYKYGDSSSPTSFRYLINHHNVIKIIDRLWCKSVINRIGDNKPNPEIFIASMISNQCVAQAPSISNTMSHDNVVLLDIQRAFDSLEWNVIQDLLISNLTRKINYNEAVIYVNSYLTVIKNRKVYYNNKLITIEKGIPTGLPSSALVFGLCMEEIIYRWMNDTKTVFGPREKYVNKQDFILNIYVDDIYLKIININKTNEIVYSLIDYLNSYNLYVNIPKCKADSKLNLRLNKLEPTDFYLGIPFTRDIKLYKKLILDEFNKRNLLNDSWSDIYYRIMYGNPSTNKYKTTYGYMVYKLKPLMINAEMNKETMCNLIKDKLFNWFEYIMYLVYYYFGFLMIYSKN